MKTRRRRRTIEICDESAGGKHGLPASRPLIGSDVDEVPFLLRNNSSAATTDIRRTRTGLSAKSRGTTGAAGRCHQTPPPSRATAEARSARPPRLMSGRSWPALLRRALVCAFALPSLRAHPILAWSRGATPAPRLARYRRLLRRDRRVGLVIRRLRLPSERPRRPERRRFLPFGDKFGLSRKPRRFPSAWRGSQTGSGEYG
jgi:hypothetical protein